MIQSITIGAGGRHIHYVQSRDFQMRIYTDDMFTNIDDLLFSIHNDNTETIDDSSVPDVFVVRCNTELVGTESNYGNPQQKQYDVSFEPQFNINSTWVRCKKSVEATPLQGDILLSASNPKATYYLTSDNLDKNSREYEIMLLSPMTHNLELERGLMYALLIRGFEKSVCIDTCNDLGLSKFISVDTGKVIYLTNTLYVKNVIDLTIDGSTHDRDTLLKIYNALGYSYRIKLDKLLYISDVSIKKLTEHFPTFSHFKVFIRSLNAPYMLEKELAKELNISLVQATYIVHTYIPKPTSLELLW